MPRNFSGTTDRISLSLGATGGTFGPGTIAAILRRTTDATVELIYYAGPAGPANRLQFALLNTDKIQIRNDTTSVVSTTSVVAADGWVCLAVTKGSGTVTPRFHIYKYSTGTWTHENASGTLGDSGTMTGNSYIGDWATGGNCFLGDIATLGRWDQEFSDAQVEPLAHSLMSWFQYNPVGLWLLDQDSTSQKVIDASGNGANESARSGTSISTSSVVGLSYGHDPMPASVLVDNIDAVTISSVTTPSAVENAQLVDSGTVSGTTSLSAVETLQRLDSATISTTTTPSAAETLIHTRPSFLASINTWECDIVSFEASLQTMRWSAELEEEGLSSVR